VAEEDAKEVSIRVEHVDSFILGKDEDSEEFKSAQRDLVSNLALLLPEHPIMHPCIHPSIHPSIQSHTIILMVAHE